MHTSDLTPTVLRELRRERGYPAVSLLMPTHRHRPDTAQDPIRLRNLLVEAKRRIGDDPKVARAVRMDLEGQLDQAAAQVDFEHSGDGLLILAAPGEHHNWLLTSPSPVPDRLVVADTFLTRNLVAARLHTRPYWVLVISEEGSHLWSGSGEQLARAEGPGFPALGFPVDPEIPDHEDALPGANFSNRTGQARDVQLRRYLRSVDGALGKALEHERRPVFLVGTSNSLALFDDLSEHSVEFAGRVPLAGLDKATAHELAERIAPALDAHAERLDAEALDRLNAARGQRRFAGGLAEVWEAVFQGRGMLLLVEEHYVARARVRGDQVVELVQEGGLISGMPVGTGAQEDAVNGVNLTAGDAEAIDEDVVDQLVERALDMETEVRFVPDDSLVEDGRVALVLRY